MKPLNLKGKKFGRLTIIKKNGFLRNGKERTTAWKCLCDCGNKKTIRARDLMTGNTISCGCFKKEILLKRNIVHGLSKSPIYQLWLGIKRRCLKKEYRYRFYKNVIICDEWMDFKNLYNWAKDKYRPGLCIDRINTLMGYSPNNCRFTSLKINTQNKKNCKRWHINGMVFESANDAAEHFGIVQSTIVSWCMGKKSGKYKYSPKENCFTERKYNYAIN